MGYEANSDTRNTYIYATHVFGKMLMRTREYTLMHLISSWGLAAIRQRNNSYART